MKISNLKNLFLILFISIIFTTTAWSNAEVDSAEIRYQYFEKMEQFGKLTNYQTTAFHDFIQANPTTNSEALTNISTSLNFQQEVLRSEIENLKSLYSKIYIDKTASKEDRKALVFQESNLSIAVHRQLILMHNFLLNPGKTNTFVKNLDQLAMNMNQLSLELKEKKSIAVPANMGINQVFEAGQSIPASVCKLLAGFCARKSLSKLMDSLDEGNFLRSKNYEYAGIESAKKILNQQNKSVYILIGNHDQPLMDIALARKVSLMLGSDQHITMTRKSVYPIPPPESAGDVVFVVDNDPKSNPVQKSIDLVTQTIQEPNKNHVSLAVYPEGMLPYTGGQMPMTVKEGAFVIARKLSNQLSQNGIKVFLVQMKTNVIEHLTSLEKIPAKVVIQAVEEVPNSPLDRSKPDEWIEMKRLQAENSFNSHRGKTQIDIFNLDKAPSSKIPYGMEIRSCSKVFIL